MHRIIIPGPPGTGKTHRLMHYLEKELKQTPADKIAYLAFSNAAVDVARERIKNDDVNIKTMHKMGKDECKLNTKTSLLKGDKWKGFKNYSRICADLSFESRVNMNGYTEYVNSHMRIIEFARNRMINLDQAAVELDLHYTTDIWLTEQIQADLLQYKKL